MKNRWILLCAFFMMAASCSGVKHPAPVNPNASPEAKALLNFLYEMKGQYTLAAQHDLITSGTKYTDKFHEITGKYPVIWGSDFSFAAMGPVESTSKVQHCGPLNLPVLGEGVEATGKTPDEMRSSLIERVKEQYAKGHIITLMWHGCFPTDGHECMGETIWAMGKTPSEQEWMDLITEGTAINTAWKAQVDVIAGYLKQLQDANIPVLWRPYHEMNGVWFWWCNKQGENGFPKLWNMMYDRFTNYHHLNNLIWVWNTNAPRDIPGDEAHPYKLFYPGNETVDVLAADVYRNDYKQSHHDDLLTLGNNKLIALGEVGNAPAPEILTQQPNWSWFMIWAYLVNGFGNSQEAFKATINDPSVITLDEVSRDAKGKYELNLQ